MLARHGIAWDFSANSEKAARDPQIPDLAHVHKSGTSRGQTVICMFSCHCSDDCSRQPNAERAILFRSWLAALKEKDDEEEDWPEGVVSAVYHRCQSDWSVLVFTGFLRTLGFRAG
jgi:hypothetical protein